MNKSFDKQSADYMCTSVIEDSLESFKNADTTKDAYLIHFHPNGCICLQKFEIKPLFSLVFFIL